MLINNQIIDDAPALEAYVNARLVYGLKLQEEQQLLSGDGTGNNLSGLLLNSTAYDTSATVAGDTFIDTIGRLRAIVQVVKPRIGDRCRGFGEDRR